MNERPRLVPGMALPPYTYVPGRRPHPHTDPLGHRYGHDWPAATSLVPERWAESSHYLIGADLFNEGYYWEAHEAWESLWHACGRTGNSATLLKALIQWAVAGVKARQEIPEGVQAHTRRARELLEEVARATRVMRYMGLSLPELIAWSEEVSAAPPTSRQPAADVEIVFPFVLWPEDFPG